MTVFTHGVMQVRQVSVESESIVRSLHRPEHGKIAGIYFLKAHYWYFTNHFLEACTKHVVSKRVLRPQCPVTWSLPLLKNLTIGGVLFNIMTPQELLQGGELSFGGQRGSVQLHVLLLGEIKMIRLLINSHVKSSRALAHLMQSLHLHLAFGEHECYVVEGGHFEQGDYVTSKEGNVTTIKCPHNSVDWTALIAVHDLFRGESGHWFYMHDTTRVGPRFFEFLGGIDLTALNSARISQAPGQSMNIGAYSQAAIDSFSDFLLSKKNACEAEIMKFKMCDYREGHIFVHDPTNIMLGDGACRTSGPTDYYGTGTLRIVEYYASIDLYKMKANWGQGTWTLSN